MRRTLTLCVCLLLLLPGLAAAQGPLPADNAVAGWQKAEAQKTFNQADLYGYIDGGAELFLEFGFEQLAVQRYRNGADEFTIEMYRMTDPVAALGIYLMKMGKETPDPAFRERHTANKHQLMFQRNRYYVMVNNLGGTDALRPALLRFATAVAAALPPAVPVTEASILPKQGLLPATVRLLRGQYALQAVYTLGDGDILQLGRTITAASGDYTDASGTYTLIVATYPDAAAAKKALEHLRANLDTYLKMTSQDDRGFIFQDYAKKFGVARLAGRRLEIKVRLAKAPG